MECQLLFSGAFGRAAGSCGAIWRCKVIVLSGAVMRTLLRRIRLGHDEKGGETDPDRPASHVLPTQLGSRVTERRCAWS